MKKQVSLWEGVVNKKKQNKKNKKTKNKPKTPNELEKEKNVHHELDWMK